MLLEIPKASCRNSLKKLNNVKWVLSLSLTDHEGFLASHAGTAPWPRGVHQLHPLALVYPWGHRLLHIQSISLRLHGESHFGLAGLSRGGLHHHTTLPHRHGNVSGHASQVV